MSFGRKSDEAKKVEIKAPPRITRTEYNSPTGDLFVNRVKGNTQYFESFLSPQTQSIVGDSLGGLESLAREIRQPDQQRLQQIQQRSQDFYDLQAGGINEAFDDINKRTQADLNKRFGGAYNATFGTDLLSRVERDRGRQLSDSFKEAQLLGEDLIVSDENSRAQRFGLFQNFLTTLNNQAQGVGTTGSNVLINEQQRAQELAIQRARLTQQALQSEAALKTSRANTLSNIAGRFGVTYLNKLPASFFGG